MYRRAQDALFFSPHKLAGGPQTPGVLVFKKRLSRRGVSANPGGGSIFFVGRGGHVYLKSAEEREEGGTPAIVGAVRVGLAMQLQHAVGVSAMAAAENRILAAAHAAWGPIEPLVILGENAPKNSPSAEADDGILRRLPIFAIAIRVGRLFLHPHFVVALLADLFGIQARGGCMCAGPYSLSLLGIGSDLSDRLQAELEKKEDNEVSRPRAARASSARHSHGVPGAASSHY